MRSHSPMCEFKILDNGNLSISASPQQIEEMKEEIENLNIIHDIGAILLEIGEYHFCNGWEMLRPEQIGALTDSPILAYNCGFDEKSEEVRIDNNTKIFWFPEYQVCDFFECLCKYGYVVFQKAVAYH